MKPTTNHLVLSAFEIGAQGGTRTHKPVKATASKTAVYTVPPLALLRNLCKMG